MATTKKYLVINERINAPKVMIIDESGKSLGIMDTAAAIQEAKSRGYDLALMAQNTLPPVARFINYGQFKYRQKKLEAKKKKNKGAKSIKSVRLTFKIGSHDVAVRQKQAVKFLTKGHKIKVDLPLRGRENLHFNLAIDKLKNFRQTLGIAVVLEQAPKRQGNVISMILRKS